MYIVGTPWKMVTFSRTIRSIAASPVNRASSTSVPPSRKVPFMPTVWPNVWNSGRQPSTTSSARTRGVEDVHGRVHHQVEVGEQGALGLPVVPLV
jgi:hypothetical protein